MPIERRVDVVIVGAGPAGLAAAIVLAQHDLRTILCEQHFFPVDKVCGEGLMPTGVAHLKRLGAAQHLSTEAVYSFAGIRYHSLQGHTAAASFVEGPGWGIRRTALSDALRCRAEEFAQLEIRSGVRAQPVAYAGDRVLVDLDGERVQTRLLIGADGLNSRLRRWAGLEGPPAKRQRWGARQHFHLAPWSSYVEVHLGPGLEAYITPCGVQQVGVAFLWDRARYRHVRGGREFFASLLCAFLELQDRLSAAPALDAVRAIGPLQRHVLSPIAEGVLLMGDAAGYLDAITGEGLSLALAQALCLEQTVVPLLLSRKGRLSRSDLQSYARAYYSIVRAYYQITPVILWLSRHPLIADRVIQALHKRPEIFQHLLSANLGLASPWSPRMISQLVWHTLRP